MVEMKVAIVGAGRGGSAMLEVLRGDGNIGIVGIVDADPRAPGLALARKYGIPTGASIDELDGGYDLLINVTGSRTLSERLRRCLPEGAELIEGVSARFFYDQLMKRKAEHEHVQVMLAELAHLNSLAQRLNASNDLDEMLQMVLHEAMALSQMPAGSVSLYDRERQELSLVVSSGFSEAFDNQPPWPVRPGGLTERILNSRKPFPVEDATDPAAGFSRNEILEREGVVSLVAVPLVLDDTTVGILYVDDFKPRSFDAEQLRLLSLLAGQAAHSIQKERLIRELRASKEAMERLNEELEERIMARTRELRMANEELVRASQAKSQFISNMSHELRTPLTSINGFSELLLDELFGPINEQQRTYLENILSSGNHLLELINGILDMAKIESGRMGLDLDRLDVRRVIEDVGRVLQGFATKAGVKLEFQVDDDVPYMLIDRTKFKQILYNLCSNAIKFSPEGGAVTVRASVEEAPGVGDDGEALRMLHVSVEDQGIGIAAKDIERIFNPFEQVESHHARRFEGTGLGLTLTRRLVELHGGTIGVTSEPGKGSCFYFDLPIEEGDGEEALARIERKQQKAPATAQESRPVQVTVKDRRKPVPVAPDAPLILVVDDDQGSQELATLYLTEAGYRVCRASNGYEALERAREEHPFLIMLDVMMPGKDGWEVLQELKLDPATADIPVMMCSVAEGQELGVALGATDYIAKPIDRKALAAKLASLGLGRKRQQGRTIHVLAVDDDPQIRELYIGALSADGYRVHTAANGQQALEMAEAIEPDVILLDLMMPEMDGFTVVERLKQHPKLMDTPVIVVSAKELTVAERMQLAGKVEDLVSKEGLSKEELIRQVHHFEQTYPQRAGLQDPVSGLFNHRYLQIRLGQEIARSERTKQPFSVVLLDIDNFSGFCELAGQAYAQAALHKIGEFLLRDSRASDVASRYRIDEFAAVLTGTEASAGVRAALRFRNAIESYPFPMEEKLGESGLTVSAGVVQYPEDGTTPEALMSTAQQLVRRAKEEGRNRVAWKENGEVKVS
ncbi:MAG: response regulator [Zetaproteobacteria bacterium]|nr:MAG: response regulator [Zetaproteobacteria bacterium]